VGGTLVVEVLKGKLSERCTKHHEGIELELFRQLAKDADGTEGLSFLVMTEGEGSVPYYI
jgi:hypothetical protein